MTTNFPCIVFLAMFKDNATFFAVVVSSHGKHVLILNKKKMCVSGYRPSSSFGHQLYFFFYGFVFFIINNFSRRKMLSVSSLFCCNLYLS